MVSCSCCCCCWFFCEAVADGCGGAMFVGVEMVEVVGSEKCIVQVCVGK